MKRFTALILGVCLLPVAGRATHFVQWLQGTTDSDGARQADEPAIVAQGVRSIIIRSHGQKAMELQAGQISVSANHEFTTASDLRRGILYRNGKPFLQLSADRVRFNQYKLNLLASGHVRVLGPEGFSLQTEQAVWSDSKGLLICPQAMFATLRGMQFRTSGAVYDTATRQLSCPANVRVETSQVSLSAGKIVADARSRRVTGQDGIEIVFHQHQPGVPAALPRAPK